VSFDAITLCVASQRVFIVVSVYFVIDSVRKRLDTLSYALFLLTAVLNNSSVPFITVFPCGKLLLGDLNKLVALLSFNMSYSVRATFSMYLTCGHQGCRPNRGLKSCNAA
jgi:hypothetical protein